MNKMTEDFQKRFEKLHNTLIADLHNALIDFQNTVLKIRIDGIRTVDVGYGKTVTTRNLYSILTSFDELLLIAEDTLRVCEIGYKLLPTENPEDDLLDFRYSLDAAKDAAENFGAKAPVIIAVDPIDDRSLKRITQDAFNFS